MSFSYFAYGYTAWIFFSWFFVYLAQVRGLNLKASALFTMLPFLSMTIGSLGGGVLSDRLTRIYGLWVGRCGLASVAFFFTAVFLVLGSRAQSPQVAGVILAGGAGALYMSQSSFWSVSADIAGRSSGVFSSIVNMVGQIGGSGDCVAHSLGSAAVRMDDVVRHCSRTCGGRRCAVDNGAS